MKIFDKIFGDPNKKVLDGIRLVVDKVNQQEKTVKKLSDEELKSESEKLKKELSAVQDEKLKEKLDEKLPIAFALVREAARRVLKQRHYDVQIIGGIVLHRGQIAEMKTGEGKTLVATLPLFLNALAGKGAHLITVNDYLAQVGAGWMAGVFDSLGLSVGVIIHGTGLIYDSEYTDESQRDERLKHFRPVERKEAYAADVTYGTNNEFGFDYLRDNMAQSLEQMVQRDLYYVIVDEIDSILIDEARTPLIISAPAEESTDKYYQFAKLVTRLKENDPSTGSGQGDYNVDEKMRAATLSDSGIEKMEKWLGIDNIYTEKGVREVHHIEQALKAHALFKANKDYVVKEGEVIIVDEFTGRLMQGRRYSEGLHQAIEAKENVKIQRESQTLATITFQNYFRMYNKLSGMTGTAVTEAEEFSKIYNLETLTIPTHRPIQRIDKNDFIYSSEESKYKAVVVEAKKRSEKGQPILIGTISIEKNEILSNLMERSGLKPNVLNAKNHKKEADYIADAGKRGTITIATNMAGRGVDIVLGGTSPEEDSAEYAQWKKDHEEIKSLGGLHVIGTERHESRRIDNQLRGRAGRQGDQGSSQFFVSMEDDLMRIFGGDRMKSIMATLKVPEDMPIENKLISRSIESAQTKVEGNNFDIRKHLVEYDDVINKHREAIYQKRKEVLNMADKIKNDNSSDELSKIIIKHINSEIEQVVSFHTAAEDVISWNLAEIYQTMSTIFPVESELESDLSEFTKGDNNKLNKAEARTAIIEHLEKMAKENYDKISEKAREAGVNWSELEKSILIRSIDTLWIEHLEAMSSVRQGIGLRGYGQRDPLIEYKKEAYRLYNELNGFIQKEVVYSIYKVGSIKTTEAQKFSAPSLLNRAINFSAPAKVMDNTSESLKISLKLKDNKGNKVGRNDPCPCGSGKKYKKCHGK